MQALPTLFDLSVYWPGPGFLAALFDAPNYGRRDVPNPKPDFRWFSSIEYIPGPGTSNIGFIYDLDEPNVPLLPFFALS